MYLQDALEIIKSAFSLPFEYLMNSNKRIYLPYLFISLIITFIVYQKTKKKSLSNFFKYTFNKKVWFSNSAKIDYIIIFINAFVKILFITPLVIIGLYISHYTSEFLIHKFGYIKPLLNNNETIFWYSISVLVVGDFFYYLFHLMMHKIPLLWKFHAVHHSATTMTPLTQYRIHPVELLITNIRVLLVNGVITGIFHYITNSMLTEYLFVGVNIFSLIFHVLGSNLRHSHVPFKYPNLLENIFISPFQHQIHHSDNKNHYDKNLGSKFAIWDNIFGTLIKSKDITKITFGIGDDNKNYNTIIKNLITPFKFKKK